MSAVYVHNITIDNGADYEQEYDMFEVGGRVIDLTGFSAKAQLRRHRDSKTSTSFIIGFIDRKNGKIKLSIPNYITSKLKPGRYIYDILFTKPSGTKEIVLEGTVRVRQGISTGCFGETPGLPGSGRRLCIAVIDESEGSQTKQGMSTKWNQFRSSYPNRTFYLLQPTTVGFGVSTTNVNYDELKCPSNFLQETTVNVPPLI